MKAEYNLEVLKKIAKQKGWRTSVYQPLGYMCRGCHEECIAFDLTDKIWMSPKGGYYHRSCAIKRLKREKIKRRTK